MGAKFAGPGCALRHSGELRPPDAGNHPGRTHGAGPDPDLDNVSARLDEVGDTIGGDHVARDHGHGRPKRPYRSHRREHLVLMTVGCVDDKHIHSGREKLICPPGHVAGYTDRGADAQPAQGIGRGAVECRPQCTLAGEYSKQASIVGHDRCEPVITGREPIKRRRRTNVSWKRQQVTRHHRSQLCEAVHRGAVGFSDDADRPAVVDHHEGAVGALGQ